MIKLLKEKIRKWLLEVLQPDLDALKDSVNRTDTKLNFAVNSCNDATRQLKISIQQNEENV